MNTLVRRGCLALSLLFATHQTSSAGLLDSFSITNAFDASIAVRGITIGGIYYDDQQELLYLSGGTDLSLQGSIRTFTKAGAFLSAINPLPGQKSFGGISAALNTTDFLVTEGWSTENLYRVSRAGVIQQHRLLDSSFVAGGAKNVGDVAMNPLTGHIWIAESSSPYRMMELDSDFNLLQTIPMLPLLGNQGNPGSAGVIGMDIDPVTGHFLVTGGFAKDSHNNLLYQILEIDSSFSTILSRFSGFEVNSKWHSITDVSISHDRQHIFAVSGTYDYVFELAVPEPSSGIIGGELLACIVLFSMVRRLNCREQAGNWLALCTRK